MSDNEAQRDGGREVDIVPPFKSRLRHDRIAGIQALRYAHPRDGNDAERDREGECPALATALNPQQGLSLIHIFLTKTFYLLRDFPGRFDTGQLWVEALQPTGEEDETCLLYTSRCV